MKLTGFDLSVLGLCISGFVFATSGIIGHLPLIIIGFFGILFFEYNLWTIRKSNIRTIKTRGYK